MNVFNPIKLNVSQTVCIQNGTVAPNGCEYNTSVHLLVQRCDILDSYIEVSMSLYREDTLGNVETDSYGSITVPAGALKHFGIVGICNMNNTELKAISEERRVRRSNSLTKLVNDYMA